MRAVRAHDMVAAAEKSLKSAKRDVSSLHPDYKSNKSQPSDSEQAPEDGHIPIDGQLILVDSFVDSPAKKRHVDNANEHIAKGDSKEAMEELKLVEVATTFTRGMMPLRATQKHVDAATKLIDGKEVLRSEPSAQGGRRRAESRLGSADRNAGIPQP